MTFVIFAKQILFFKKGEGTENTALKWKTRQGVINTEVINESIRKKTMSKKVYMTELWQLLPQRLPELSSKEDTIFLPSPTISKLGIKLTTEEPTDFNKSYL